MTSELLLSQSSDHLVPPLSLGGTLILSIGSPSGFIGVNNIPDGVEADRGLSCHFPARDPVDEMQEDDVDPLCMRYLLVLSVVSGHIVLNANVD